MRLALILSSIATFLPYTLAGFIYVNNYCPFDISAWLVGQEWLESGEIRIAQGLNTHWDLDEQGQSVKITIEPAGIYDPNAYQLIFAFNYDEGGDAEW